LLSSFLFFLSPVFRNLLECSWLRVFKTEVALSKRLPTETYRLTLLHPLLSPSFIFDLLMIPSGWPGSTPFFLDSQSTSLSTDSELRVPFLLPLIHFETPFTRSPQLRQVVPLYFMSVIALLPSPLPVPPEDLMVITTLYHLDHFGITPYALSPPSSKACAPASSFARFTRLTTFIVG